MRSDLKRLGPEEYLNDTLIEFGLKYIPSCFNVTNLLMRPLGFGSLNSERRIQRLQIRFMSSARSSTRNSIRRSGSYRFFWLSFVLMLYSPEEGYQSVRKWTSKVDLFSKKYIIVPINEKWVLQFS